MLKYGQGFNERLREWKGDRNVSAALSQLFSGTKEDFPQPKSFSPKEQRGGARVKLGLIAIAEKLMTSEQTEELNTLQRQTDRRFGDLAIEKGYLTEQQLERLLENRGEPLSSTGSNLNG